MKPRNSYQMVQKGNIKIDTPIAKVEAKGAIAWAVVIFGAVILFTFIYLKYGHKIPGVKKIRRKR